MLVQHYAPFFVEWDEKMILNDESVKIWYKAVVSYFKAHWETLYEKVGETAEGVLQEFEFREWTVSLPTWLIQVTYTFTLSSLVVTIWFTSCS